jgi:hypothetical protein
MRIEFDSYRWRQNPREGIWDVTCQLAKQIVVSAGSRWWDSATQGQIFSEFRPQTAGSSSGPSVSGCSWRVFTTCHFIVVISAQQGCGKAELPGKDSPAIGRNTCGGPSTFLCGTATSAARMDDHVASVSAQTILGGVLGGNFGVLYDDYAKGRFVSGCAINKEDE